MRLLVIGALVVLTGGGAAALLLVLAPLMAGAPLLGIGAVATAVSNTFFWSYWTLTYLRLSGETASA